MKDDSIFEDITNPNQVSQENLLPDVAEDKNQEIEETRQQLNKIKLAL